MTKLLEQAVEAARELSPDEHDEIARMIFGFAADINAERVPLTPGQRESIAVSRDRAARGEFAGDAEIEAIWKRFR